MDQQTKQNENQESHPETENEAIGIEKHALPLYEFLKKQSPALDWNQNNELMLSGSLVPNSDIFQLIKDATNLNNENVTSDEAVWRVFKKWLLDNNVPLAMVNNNVKKKDQLPAIQNPVNTAKFPSIRSLKSKYRYKRGSSPVVQNISNTSTQSGETPNVDTEKKEKRKRLDKSPLRRSIREKRSPKKYGRGKIATNRKIKWLKF